MKNFRYNEVKLLLEEAQFEYNFIYDLSGIEREKQRLFLRIDKLETWLKDLENDSN
jgi:hypothetical protein